MTGQQSGSNFDKYFEKDFVSGDQWWQDFGERMQEFTVARFGMRKSWDPNAPATPDPSKPNGGPKKGAFVEKPVMYLAELGEKAVFISQTNYKTLRELLGPGFSENPRSRGAVLKMTCREISRRTGKLRVIEIVGLGERKSVPMGTEAAAKFMAFIRDLDLGLTDFFWWLRTHNAQADLAEDLAELPVEDWPSEGRNWARRFCEVARAEPDSVRKP